MRLSGRTPRYNIAVLKCQIGLRYRSSDSILNPFSNDPPGLSPKVLADQFHAKPSEIRRFLNGQLDAGRTRELADRMRAVGSAL